MTTFAVAYVVVWLAVVLYIACLARGQRQLTARIESLRAQLEASRHERQPDSRAA
jgi:CcmD family protein